MKDQNPTLVDLTDQLFVFCASLKLAVISLGGIAAVLAVATFYEARFGTEAAQQIIYKSWWFAALLAALAVNVFAAAIIRFPWKRHQTGFVITHTGILILLFGCVYGYHNSLDGMLIIEEGTAANQVRLRDSHLLVRFADEDHRAQGWLPINPIREGSYPGMLRYLASPIVGYASAPRWPAGDELTVQPDDEFLAAADRDIELTVIDWLPNGKPVEKWQAVGRDMPMHGGVQPKSALHVRLTGQVPGAQAGPMMGDDEVASFWLALPPRQQSADDSQLASMANAENEHAIGPMVVRSMRLAAADREAFLAGEDEPRLGPGVRGLLEIGVTPDGDLLGRRVSSNNGLAWAGEIKVGQAQAAFMALRFTVEQYLPRAEKVNEYEPLAIKPGEQGAPAIKVRAKLGDVTRELWLPRTGVPELVSTGRVGEAFSVAYGVDHVPLDFSIELSRFERTVDPGTDQAATFASYVRVHDHQHDESGESHVHGPLEELTKISMNEPLGYDGLKFYQSGFQELPSGEALTVLSVNRDPGRPVKYAGCLLIVFGIFTMFYMRAYTKKPRKPAAGKAAVDVEPGANTGSGSADQHQTPSPVGAANEEAKTGNAMRSVMLFFAMLGILGGSSVAQAGELLSDESVDALRRVPVMHQGRVMPLDTVASRTIRQIAGRSKPKFAMPGTQAGPGEAGVVGGGEVVKLDPVELMLAAMSDPRRWSRAQLIQVNLLEAREWLGMSADQSHVALLTLDNHPEFWNRARQLGHEEAEAEESDALFEPTRLEEAIMDVARKGGTMRMMMHGSLLGLLPFPQYDEIREWMQAQTHSDAPTPVAMHAMAAYEAALKMEEPSLSGVEFDRRVGWLTFDALVATPPDELPADVADRWARAGGLWAVMLEAYRDGDAAEVNRASSALADEWPTVSKTAGHENLVDLEVMYNRLHTFRWAVVVYLIGSLLFGIGMLVKKKGVYFAAVAAMLLAMGINAYGFGLRIAITGWAPVTNMYETVIWVALVAAAIGLVFELIHKKRAIGLVACVVAAVCALVAEIMPPGLGKDLANLQPVLRSNFWLTIHVLTIVSSYAAFALALGLGNVVMGMHLFGKTNRSWLAAMNLYIYRSLQVGVLLIAAGTILGGVWADQAWGRFWGWDPKEVWALIVLLVYLAILHGRFAGWIRPFGLAAGAVMGFMSVIMAWYGVNFVLGAGLHSYGFGTGGQGAMFTYVIFQTLFVVGAFLRYRAADTSIKETDADSAESQGAAATDDALARGQAGTPEGAG